MGEVSTRNYPKNRKSPEPTPDCLSPEDKVRFAALRKHHRETRGVEIDVAYFRARRKYGTCAPKRKDDAPQTAEGVREILRRKGLA